MSSACVREERVVGGLDVHREIDEWRRRRSAVIVAHYYQDEEIQDIADFVGDSLDLSRRAAETSASVIVFAGVHFMAETAKLLNPGATVLLPDANAGCSLADRCEAGAFARWIEQHPGSQVVTYINSSAAVKALSDVIVTSSNAVHIVNRLDDRPILFGPDRRLGQWVMRQTGREMTLWPGVCVVHEQFSHRRLVRMRFAHPEARVLAHPECEAAVLELADHVGSTGSLLRYVIRSPDRVFIVATEAGIIHQMRRARPDAEFIPAEPNSGCDCAICPYMRLNTLEKVRSCMEQMSPAIEIDEAIAVPARRAVERMLEMSEDLPAR